MLLYQNRVVDRKDLNNWFKTRFGFSETFHQRDPEIPSPPAYLVPDFVITSNGILRSQPFRISH